MIALLRPSRCAICLVEGGADELYPAHLAAGDFNDGVFSARRLPDGVHCRVVRCRRCGLVRSDPAPDPDALAALYRCSRFEYATEVPNLVRTYSRYLTKLRAGRRRGPALLEVGSGNGFMLQEALRLGFRSVVGVEPSEEAIADADPAVRPFLLGDVLRPGLLEDARFDVACMFQVLDHLPDPGSALDLVRDALKPGGRLLVLNHNVRSLSARALRQRSPIIDIEHTYLYDRATLSALCRAHGLIVEKTAAAWNWCSVGYLAHLLPLPLGLKEPASRALAATRLGRASLPLPLGNLYLVARKPRTGELRG